MKRSSIVRYFADCNVKFALGLDRQSRWYHRCVDSGKPSFALTFPYLQPFCARVMVNVPPLNMTPVVWLTMYSPEPCFALTDPCKLI